MAMEFDKEQEVKVVGNFGRELETVDPEEPVVPDVDDINDDIEEPQEEGQLDLFGGEDLGGGVTLSAAADTKGKGKNGKLDKKKSSEPKKKEPKTVGEGYMIYYAGHQVAVPKDGMELEDVRIMLHADWPEFSKERTRFDVDHEKKEIVPSVNGGKNG